MGRLTRALPAPVVLILFCAVWRLPTVNDLPWLNDEGTYATVGQAIMRGEALYRQIWENKPPGIYLLFGVVHALLGLAHLLLGIRVLALLAAVAAQIAIYRLARRGAGRSTALLAVGLSGLALDLPLLDGASANAEIFMTAATSAGMAFLWRGMVQGIGHEDTFNTETRRHGEKIEGIENSYTSPGDRKGGTTRRHPAAAGVVPAIRSQPEARETLIAGIAFGVAILLKLPAGADLLAALAILPARPESMRGAARLAPLWLLLAGVALPVGAVTIWLATRGLVGDALYAMIGYNRGYVSTGQGDHPFILNVLGALGLLALLWLGLRLVRGRGETFFAGAMCWWLALALLGALASGRSYPHYYLQAVPPLAICLALLIRRLPSIWGYVQHGDTETRRDYGELRDRVAIRALSVLLIVWAVGVPLVSWQALRQDRASTPPGSNHLAYYGYIWERLTGGLSDAAYGNRIDPRVERNLAVVRYLRDHPASPRRLYIWGNTPWIYYLSGYEHSARFTSAYYRPVIPGGMEQTVVALRTDPPPYIVVIEPPKPASSALAALVRARYRQMARIEDAVIYRLRS